MPYEARSVPALEDFGPDYPVHRRGRQKQGGPTLLQPKPHLPIVSRIQRRAPPAFPGLRYPRPAPAAVVVPNPRRRPPAAEVVQQAPRPTPAAVVVQNPRMPNGLVKPGPPVVASPSVPRVVIPKTNAFGPQLSKLVDSKSGITPLSERKLGEGSYGIVSGIKFRATNGLPLVGALKTAKNPIGKRMLIAEARLNQDIFEAVKGRTPMVFPQPGDVIHKNDESGDVMVLSEFIHGETIFDFVHRKQKVGRQVSETDVGVIAYGLAIALLHLFRLDLVHGDLKVDNVMLNLLRFPSLLDYGMMNRIGTFRKQINIAGRHVIHYPIYLYYSQDPGAVKLTPQLDMFGFGLIILSLLSSRMVTCRDLPTVMADRELHNYCHGPGAHPILGVLYDLSMRCVRVTNPDDKNVPSAEEIVTAIEQCAGDNPKSEFVKTFRLFQRYKWSGMTDATPSHFVAQNSDPGDFGVRAPLDLRYTLIARDNLHDDIMDKLNLVNWRKVKSDAFTNAIVAFHDVCTGVNPNRQNLKEKRIGGFKVSDLMLSEAHYSLVSLLDFAITNKNPQIIVDPNTLVKIISDAVRCREVSPIQSVDSVSMYSRLLVFLLRRGPRLTSVHPNLKPLLREIIQFSKGKRDCPNAQQIRNALRMIR
ncbi:MAG: protein kinase [Holosporales bacterium]|nr:protein kinase [Holosporales bacterium]